MRAAAADVALVLLAGCGGGGGESTAPPPASAELDPACEPQAYNEFVADPPGEAEEVAGAAFARSPLGPGGEVERLAIDRDEQLHVRLVRDGKTIGLATLTGTEGAWSVSEMTICTSNSP
jgi:hypothetical protein